MWAASADFAEIAAARLRAADVRASLRTARQGIDVESDEASKRRQAKGILMERHRISPEDAFDILRNSSRQLNVRLREVARTLTETDQV